MAPRNLPPLDFARRALDLIDHPAGCVWQRIYDDKYSNSLGVGRGLSRFSDPTGTRFGLLYLASTTKGAFAEAVLRDRAVGSTAEMAARAQAYVLTDRATWLAHRVGDQRILVEGDARLFDQYEIAVHKPARNGPAADSFVDWLISNEGQEAIAAFRINGQQAFVPNAKPIN